FSRIIKFFLIDNGIHRNRRLTSPPVTNDQFSLTSPDGNHGVDRLHTRLQWFRHRLPIDHTRSFSLQRHIVGLTFYLSLAIDRLSQWIDNSSEQTFSHVDRSDHPGSFHT